MFFNKFSIDILLVYGLCISVSFGSSTHKSTNFFGDKGIGINFFIAKQSKSNKLSTTVQKERDKKKPWLNILCKYADTVDEPISPDEVQKMFGDTYPFLGHYWKETTYGHIDISGTKTINHWLTLPHNRNYYVSEYVSDDGGITSTTNLNFLETDCKNVAGSEYDENLYYSTNLFFVDGGSYGAKDTTTWLPPMKLLGTIAHEMGHVYGLDHSSGRYDYDYDSPWDVMSASYLGSEYEAYEHTPQHTIAFHKEKLGAIFPIYNFNNTELDTSSGYTFHLSRLEEQANEGSYLIANIRSIDKSKHYTVETRDPIGYDSSLPAKAIIIHEVENNSRAYVVGSNKKDSKFDILSDEGTMWRMGETFTDTVNNISIEIVSETSTGFNVRVIAPRVKPLSIDDSNDSDSSDSSSDAEDTSDSSSDSSSDAEDTSDSSFDSSSETEDTSDSPPTKGGAMGYLLPLLLFLVLYRRKADK